MLSPIKKAFAPFEKYLLLETGWLIFSYKIKHRKNPTIKKISWMLREITAIFVNRLKIVRMDNSYAGEHQALSDAMNKLGITEGHLIDIGAADGIRQSSSVNFLKSTNWSGTLFEFDPKSFAKLSFLYNDNDSVSLCKVKVNPNNIVSLLEGLNVPKQVAYLNIDIDSYDLSVLRTLIDGKFRPLVISMEINEKFPPNIDFEVLYSDEHYWQGDHFFGCSLTAAFDAMSVRNYSLVDFHFNNAIFVDNQQTKAVPVIKDLRDAYKNGYLQQEDRKLLFPWNENIEILQTQSNASAEEFLRDLFKKYNGRYKLEFKSFSHTLDGQ